MRIIIHLSCAHVNLCRSLFTSFYQFSVVKQQLGNARSVGHAHTGSAACGRYAMMLRLGRHAPDRRTASRRMHCVAQGTAAAGRVLRHVRRTAFICVARHIKRTAIVCAAHHFQRTALICSTCHGKHTARICTTRHVKRTTLICALRCAPFPTHRAVCTTRHFQRTALVCATCHVKQTALCAARHIKRTVLICALRHVKRTMLCAPDQAHRAHLHCAPDQEYRVYLHRTHTYPHWPCICITANTAAAEL